MPTYKDKKRGTWRVIITETVDGKSRQRQKRGFATRREAQMWEAEQRLSVEGKTAKTFEDMFEEHLLDLDSSPGSAQRKRGFLVKHFPAFSEPFESLTKENLIKWRNGLRGEGLATRTINSGITYVKAVCSYAERVYNIPNAGSVLKRYKLTEEEKKERPVWTVAQFQRFTEFCDPAYIPFFTFLFWTGCRRGEALALSGADFEGNRVRIDKSIKHYKNGLTWLKTGASKRTITVDSKTMELLQPLIDAADPFVFGGKRSLAISSVQRKFTKAKQEAGLPDIRIHDLRHSHATILINNNANIVAISKRLGHASINQTLKTYSHLLPESDAELMITVEKLR